MFEKMSPAHRSAPVKEVSCAVVPDFELPTRVANVATSDRSAASAGAPVPEYWGWLCVPDESRMRLLKYETTHQ